MGDHWHSVSYVPRACPSQLLRAERTRAAEMVINAFLTSMGLTPALIPQLHCITGIPETNLGRWQHMIAENPE
jgi:hypothetical protein